MCRVFNHIKGPMPQFIKVVSAAVAVLALAAGTARSDVLSERMEALAGARSPVEIEADSAKYDRKTGVYDLSGNVRITQGGKVLTADAATLNMLSGQADAAGRVTLTDTENILLAETLSVNFDTRMGVIEKGSIFVKKENYHIVGERIERLSDNEYRAVSASLTTCDAATPFWRVTATDLSIRMGRDVRAKNVVFRIKEVPVLYTPYAWFPLLKRRTSGFLVPGVGFSTDDGFRFFNSFYWAPADNFDATFDVDYRSERGVGLGAELRLALDPTSESRLYGYYMDDRKDALERYNIEFRHRQVITDRLTVKADVNLSDREFFKDLAETTMDRTKRSIDSNVFVTNVWEDGMAYLLGQYTLGLDVNRDMVVQRIPEAGFDITAMRIDDSPFYLDASGSAAYFVKRKGVSGGRLDMFPKLTGVFDLGGIRVLPRIGYRETMYDITGVETRVVKDPLTGNILNRRDRRFDDERGLFGTGLTVQTELSRMYTTDGGFLKAVKHTFEPKVAYNYVVQRGGTQFVKFDGVDTLGRRSIVAYSLTNRFVFRYADRDGAPAMDYLTIKLGQFFDYHRDTAVFGVKRHLSCIYGEVVYLASYGLKLNTDFRFDANKNSILSVNTNLKYEDRQGRWHVVLGQRTSKDTDQTFMSPSMFDFFTPSTEFMSDFVVATRGEREKVNFLLFEAGVKLWQGWSLSGKVWYDLHAENLRETDVSARYESQCWGVRVEFARRPGEKQVMVMLDFKGMGSVKL